MAADDNPGGGGERPQRHPLVGWFLTCAILVGFGVFMVYIFERALYEPPEFKAIVSAYEGLDAPAAGAGTAPTFRVALRVGNEFNWRPFCAERGSVVVAYAGVPLARAALPGFCVPGGERRDRARGGHGRGDAGRGCPPGCAGEWRNSASGGRGCRCRCR